MLFAALPRRCFCIFRNSRVITCAANPISYNVQDRQIVCLETLHNRAVQPLYCSVRHKYKKQKVQDDSDDEDEEEEEVVNDGSKLLTAHMSSCRVDAVLKSGLATARNKVEELFYQNKIRVNGQKLLKKSARLNPGDEVDAIKGVSPMNEEMMVVTRIVVVSCKSNDEGDGLIVKLRRYKNLTIENYPDSHSGPAS